MFFQLFLAKRAKVMSIMGFHERIKDVLQWNKWSAALKVRNKLRNMQRRRITSFEHALSTWLLGSIIFCFNILWGNYWQRDGEERQKCNCTKSINFKSSVDPSHLFVLLWKISNLFRDEKFSFPKRIIVKFQIRPGFVSSHILIHAVVTQKKEEKKNHRFPFLPSYSVFQFLHSQQWLVINHLMNVFV